MSEKGCNSNTDMDVNILIIHWFIPNELCMNTEKITENVPLSKYLLDCTVPNLLDVGPKLCREPFLTLKYILLRNTLTEIWICVWIRSITHLIHAKQPWIPNRWAMGSGWNLTGDMYWLISQGRYSQHIKWTEPVNMAEFNSSKLFQNSLCWFSICSVLTKELSPQTCLQLCSPNCQNALYTKYICTATTVPTGWNEDGPQSTWQQVS